MCTGRPFAALRDKPSESNHLCLDHATQPRRGVGTTRCKRRLIKSTHLRQNGTQDGYTLPISRGAPQFRCKEDGYTLPIPRGAQQRRYKEDGYTSQSHGVRHSAGAKSDIPIARGAPRCRCRCRRATPSKGGSHDASYMKFSARPRWPWVLAILQAPQIELFKVAVTLGPLARAAVSCSSKGLFQSSGSPGEQDESRWVSTSSRRILSLSVTVAP